METMDDDSSSVVIFDPSELDHLHWNIHKSQIATKRLFVPTLPISGSLLNLCSYKTKLAILIQNHLQQKSSISDPTAIVLADNQNNNDVLLSFTLTIHMYGWLVG
jgi:hypothetical protein